MKNFGEVEKLLKLWEQVIAEFDECDDAVSKVAIKQAELICSTLEWVLDIN